MFAKGARSIIGRAPSPCERGSAIGLQLRTTGWRSAKTCPFSGGAWHSFASVTCCSPNSPGACTRVALSPWSPAVSSKSLGLGGSPCWSRFRLLQLFFSPALFSKLSIAASLILCAALIVAGLYILSNYLRALVWALVLAVALWPAYDRLRRKTRRSFAKKLLPILVTALVGSTVFLPLTVLAIEVVREVHEIVDYGRSVEDSGIPVPVFVSRLPYGGPWLADWWNGHLAHAGWAKDFIQQINTSSTRELGRSIGLNAIHRAVLFGVCLLTLFFLFLDGEAVSSQCLTASRKLFGERGERVALQMVASVHGTVNGLVFVAIGEGALLGVVYFFTKLPHPILFGTFTAVAAMIPFAAAIAVGLATLVLLGNGAFGAAIIVILAGLMVTFVADHFVRPKLIGGATKLPFLWVLLGILGGVESFQLLPHGIFWQERSGRV